MRSINKVMNGEEIFSIIKRVPRPIICLNSIMELIGRIKTMFLIFRASTPVESF
jgi:hypothetical protein